MQDHAIAPNPAAEMILRLRADGRSFHAIAAALNRYGFKGANGGRWYAATIRLAYQSSIQLVTPLRSLPCSD